MSEEIYLAGGCLWGVQEFVRHLPGVLWTEAGRANGSGDSLDGPYDGYAECVRTRFDPAQVSVDALMGYFFEIIDPYSLNRQGPDEGSKYRTGVYSRDPAHLAAVRRFIRARPDAAKIVVEVLGLKHYLRSAEEHQDRLTHCPEEPCHLPRHLLHKYR
jgi:peptide-methionine (S)-S-oxide reductase